MHTSRGFTRVHPSPKPRHTHRPKLVPLSHGQLGIGALCVASTLRLRRSAVALNVMPLFHLHGLMINVLVSAVAGAAVVCGPRWRVLETFSEILTTLVIFLQIDVSAVSLLNADTLPPPPPPPPPSPHPPSLNPLRPISPFPQV